MANVNLAVTIGDQALAKMRAAGPPLAHVPQNFTWWGKRDLMVWDAGDNQVERWRPVDNGFICVEVWTP